MYLQFCCRIIRIKCQARNVQFIPKVNGSHKTLVKPQLRELDSNLQTSSNTLNNVKTHHVHLQLDSSIVPISSPVTLKQVENFKEIESNNIVKWREIELESSKLGNFYLRLSKFRLTSLVVMTSMIGYFMAPNQFELISFLSCAVGTGLCSSAANSVNQFLEIPFDAQMSRTRNRVLVQGYLTPLHAIGFATIIGSLGICILYEGANPLTAALGASNLFLYTMIYTPMKRISILNTWIGSIVGAIPPLMGWAACQGSLDPGALILGGILYAWQFPHFNALSWNLRPDYSKAGYRMMAVTDPGLCRRTALRYTIGITVCSSLAPVLDITHWSFGVFSLPVNLYFVYLAHNFYKESDSKNSRKLFRFSLLHLPVLMGLMLITKKGLFDSIFNSNFESNDIMINKHEESISSVLLKYNPSIKDRQTSGSGLSNLSISPTLHAQSIR